MCASKCFKFDDERLYSVLGAREIVVKALSKVAVVVVVVVVIVVVVVCVNSSMELELNSKSYF